jgi:Tol biopolymer transport system component
MCCTIGRPSSCRLGPIMEILFAICLPPFGISCSTQQTIPGYFGRVSLAPDGRTLYFGAGDRRGSNIFSIAPDGTGLTQITQGSDHVYADPSPSPDGRSIAFASLSAGSRSSQIWAMNPDGTNKRQLTFDGSAGCASFSPDGRKMLFAKWSAPGGWNIWEMNVDGSSARPLTHENYFYTNPPCFSPDGKHVVFAAELPPLAKLPSIYKLLVFDLRPDGSMTPPRPIPLPPYPSAWSLDQIDGDPCFSPDNSLIVFTSLRNSRESPYDYEVWTCRPDGTGLRQVTHDQSRDQSPVFSPDMKYIYYGTGYREVKRINLSDGITEILLPWTTKFASTQP